MANQKLLESIARKAREHELEPALVLAICEVETNFNPYAMRYEPHFKWINMRLKKPRIESVETERIGQKTSWGMMQVMGAVARELGFDSWFTELSDPLKGVEYGCKQLARLKKRFGDAPETLAAAYNAGSPRKTKDGKFVNQLYVDKVMKAREKYLSYNEPTESKESNENEQPAEDEKPKKISRKKKA